MIAIPFKNNGINFKEKAFKKTLTISAIVAVIILIAIFFTLLINSFPSIKAFGARFFTIKPGTPLQMNMALYLFLLEHC